jgi:TATA-binding protein-associated factor Taf7
VDAQQKKVDGQPNPMLKKKFQAKLTQLKQELAALEA